MLSGRAVRRTRPPPWRMWVHVRGKRGRWALLGSAGISWALFGVSLGRRGSSACGVGVWGVAFVAARGAVIPWVCSWAGSGSVPSRL